MKTLVILKLASYNDIFGSQSQRLIQLFFAILWSTKSGALESPKEDTDGS